MIKNIDELKQKADIVDIISHFVPLRREGVNYKGLCPFHSEKTPSFIVSPHKQIYKCFSCDKSGDVINFLQDFKALSFNEAVAELAQMQGLSIEYDSNAKSVAKDLRAETFKAYELLFKKGLDLLEANAQVKQYLLNRGLESSDFAFFNIGLMPSVDEVKSLFGVENALKLGILKKRSDGAFYTPFKERIIFALRNPQHKIVGIAGRSHPYYNFRNAPKYINSSESFIYQKSANLYLFSNARQSIVKQSEVIIVEGYMDCIALHKLGYTNAVATSGTAFNNTHISALYRLSQNLSFKLCFDNDEAGAKANIRALNLLFLSKCYEAKVLVLKKDYKDIGEVLEKSSKDTNFYQEWNGLKYYTLYHYKNAKNAKAKDEFLKHIAEMIDNEQNYYSKTFIIDSVCEVLNIPKDYFNKKHIAPQNKDIRVLKLLYNIYNDENCAYIAKESLDIEALPREYQSDLKIFLESSQLKGKAQNIALNDKLKSHYTQKSFYADVMQFNILKAESDLNMAKLKKDINQILHLSQYIKEQRDLIRVFSMM